MGKRTTGRKLAMQALYQAEIRSLDVKDITKDFFQAFNYEKKTVEWAAFLAENTWSKKSVLDKAIKKYSIDWDLDRINPIDRNLLRLALYELRYTETPPSVVLNEVIEIAKKYSGVSENDIMKLNNMSNGRSLKAGQYIKIKPKG